MLQIESGRASGPTRTVARPYLPIVATVTFNDEPEPFAVAAVLRPGNVLATYILFPGAVAPPGAPPPNSPGCASG